ncbi:MaoC family dehydratase [Dactylosporangium sp. NPDC051541]|uniref:MaoC family dehydratase n=1 Tax=Dactylosporangium sp. NPDC051541 TaxID=3363977 RepID=UPI0037A084CD
MSVSDRSGGTALVVGPLTRTDLVRYQGASGDFQPIHHDEGFAREAGLPAPLSLGMLQAGFLATWATDRFGAENIRAFRVRFAARVFPGDTLTCDGTITGARTNEHGEHVQDVEMTCTKQDGTVAVHGWATFTTSDEAA